MCGIAAISGLSGTARDAEIDEMLALLAHRGPDGTGRARFASTSLGHRRLAIIDPRGGAQPLANETGELGASVNGEIYNHGELKRGLDQHIFRTRSDSEVVVHAFEERGARFVNGLDGMFAFVLASGDEVFAARDPLGIKPLYFGRNGAGALLFASELKALFGRADDVQALPPGHYFSSKSGVTRYFRPGWRDSERRRDRSAAPELRRALERAVEKRLMADVPVGVLLSGGLDSSIVAALAARSLGKIHSFSVGAAGAADLEAAREMARAIGSQHHELVVGEREIARVLERVIHHLESYDPALVRSAVPCFLVSELAARHVKVVLTGEGADEAFGGYGYFANSKGPEALHEESCRLLESLHAMNLQRVDRMTMAHGLEGRVPFLDVELLELAMSLDPKLKLHTGERAEKWLLRHACEDLLPPAILRRKKAEFADGAGIPALLAAHAEARVSERDFEARAQRFPDDTPETREEYLYRDLFARAFPDAQARGLVARWRGGFAEASATNEPEPDSPRAQTGSWTYNETVSRGFYGRFEGGLSGKHDNVRVYWEDQITRLVLRPELRALVAGAKTGGRRLRILDLGCGSGQGLDLLTSIPEKDAGLDVTERFVVEHADVGNYLGLDLSPAMVEQGRRNHRRHGYARFAPADLRRGLDAVRAEPAFDLYLSTYGSLSHLDLDAFERLLGDVARHAAPRALMVADLIGRLSPEWPAYWRAETESEKVREYSMSYLFDARERAHEAVEKFKLRFWTSAELEACCARASAASGRRVTLARAVDRSLFVGRHVDTGEYGTFLPPVRRVVNQLHQDYLRTDLDRLLVTPESVPGFDVQNRFFSELARAWNALVRFCQARLRGSRQNLFAIDGWSDFPVALQLALVSMDRVIDSVAWMTIGDPRANIIEPQLGYLLRSLELGLERGAGSGHGLLGLIRID